MISSLILYEEAREWGRLLEKEGLYILAREAHCKARKYKNMMADDEHGKEPHE